MSINTLPPEAIRWLTVWSEATVLTIDGSAAVARRVSKGGHQVFALSPNPERIDRLREVPHTTPVHARPEAVPTDPFQFDVVLTHQGLHQVDAARVLDEAARVLRPGGCFAASYLVRDDSVPWVRRLAALLRHYDPMAMAGNFGHQSLSALQDSPHFTDVEQRGFRIWQPISLPELQEMVAAQPLSAGLDAHQRQRLTSEVAALYTSAVRPGERLRLPYQLLCHRGFVSHDALSGQAPVPGPGIEIQM